MTTEYTIQNAFIKTLPLQQNLVTASNVNGCTVVLKYAYYIKSKLPKTDKKRGSLKGDF